MLALMGIWATGCDDYKKSSAPAPKPTNAPVGSNPLNAPGEYLGAVAKAKKMSEKTAELASLRQAVQLFQVQEERYPKDLEELVAKQYLPALPKPPYGLKYVYDPKTGDVKAVSQ